MTRSPVFVLRLIIHILVPEVALMVELCLKGCTLDKSLYHHPYCSGLIVRKDLNYVYVVVMVPKVANFILRIRKMGKHIILQLELGFPRQRVVKQFEARCPFLVTRSSLTQNV